MSDYFDDAGWRGTLEDVRGHYAQVVPALEELAALGETFPCLGFAGNAGWYVTRRETDVDEIEAGREGRARCRTLQRDLDAIVTDQVGAEGRGREVYNITSWKDEDAPYEWRSFAEGEAGKEWAGGEKPTPDYGQLRGFGFWADLDLADKQGRAGLSDDDRAIVERGLQRAIEEVAEVYGVGADAVYGLDSGGGAYVYGPPEAALPVADYLEDDAEARRLFFDDLAGRLREEVVGERVEAAIASVEGAAELFDADYVQNGNRQSKAPGAIHHSHDVVVTPLRRRDPETGEPTAEVDYEPTPVSEFGEDEAASLEAWCAGLTAIEHTGAVETLVPTLYPELAGETAGWREIVDERVAQLRERERERAAAAGARQEYVEEWAGDADDAAGLTVRERGAYEGAAVVTDAAEQEAAIDTIDVREVVREHACDAWDTSARSHEVTFDPSWRDSASGQSCAIPNGDNSFVDNRVDAGGGPVTAYALGVGLLDSATDDLAPVYGAAVDGMRSDGYEIPVWVPEASDEHAETPFWAVRRAALALGVVAPDDLVEREGDEDDGDTYLGFPDAAAYNDALDALEAEGVEHGRERAETTGPADVYDTPAEFAAADDASAAEADDDLPATAPTDPAGELLERDGCYGYLIAQGRGDERREEWAQVTNFTLETLEFVETDSGEEMKLRVHPAHARGTPYDVTVKPTVFNEPRTFREEVVTGRTTTFSNVRDALNDLRRTVGAQVAPTRTGVDHVGAATASLDEWVTPDGVLTADGWAESPEHEYYAEASSDSGDESIVGEKWALAPEDGAEFDVDEVRRAIELLPRSRLPGQAIATLGWFYSAPAKPLIHDREGEFNHLHVRGKTESGKTSYLQLLAEALGMEPSPWGAEATNFSLEQLHVGSRGAPVWIDEYKPSDMGQRTVDQLHRLLRTATREGTVTKGRPDQSFMKFRLQSPVCLSGEQQVGEPAVRRRMLQVNLSERATRLPDHVEAYSRLAGEPYEDETGTTQAPGGVDLSHHARAYYRFLLSREAGRLAEMWAEARGTTAEILDALGLSLQDSEFQAAQTVVFGFSLYRLFAYEMGVPDERLPGEAERREAVRHLADSVGAGGQRREHGDEFLELLAQAANSGYLSAGGGEDDEPPAFRVYNPSVTPDEALAIHLPTAYPAVKRFARDFNVEDDYNLLNKSDYADEFRDLAAAENSHVAETNHQVRLDGSKKRCLILDPHATREKLGADFDLAAFGVPPRRDDDRDLGEMDSVGDPVEDDPDAADETTDGDEPDYLTAAEVEGSATVADRAKAPPIRGRVLAVWENRYGQPVAEVAGPDEDEDGSIDLQIEGHDSPETVPLSAGAVYEFDGLRYRSPDDERPYYEMRPPTTATRLDTRDGGAEEDGDGDGEGRPAPDADADSGERAAADGGAAPATTDDTRGDGDGTDATEAADDGPNDRADSGGVPGQADGAGPNTIGPTSVPEDAEGPRAYAQLLAEFADARGGDTDLTALRGIIVDTTEWLDATEFDAGLERAKRDGLVQVVERDGEEVVEVVGL